MLTCVASACATVVEEGVRALVGEDEASGPRSAAPQPSGDYGASDRGEGSSIPERRPPSTSETVYQVAPTHDWLYGTGPRPFTPSLALFDAAGPGKVSCRPVPVGLAQVYSADVGPAASPLLALGPVELGIAGPDGAAGDALMTSRHDVSARALESGARVAGEGVLCSNRVFFYLRIGRTPPPLAIHH
ncbi:MAG: hypothetical protein PVF90_02105 [Gemmatimonadota bacterium]